MPHKKPAPSAKPQQKLFIAQANVFFKKILVFIALFLIMLYQKLVSPFKPPCCRFTPTCSAYAKEAFLLHGAAKGAMLTLKRIFKCHPWGGFGYDPVPPQLKKDKK